MDKTIFDLLKTASSTGLQPMHSERVFFQITQDDGSYSLEVVKSANSPVEFDYHAFSGKLRQLLQMIRQIKEKRASLIRWESDDDRILLAEHDYLLPLLSEMDHVIDETGSPISFSEEVGEFKLEIIRNESSYTCRLLFIADGKQDYSFDLLSRNFVLRDNTVYEIPELADNYRLLPVLNSKILLNQLEPYLSLFFSNFSSIALKMDHFKIEEREAVTAFPTLIIREIDPNQCLHIVIKSTLPDYPDDFLIDYNVSRIVSVDSLEGLVLVQDLLTGDQGRLLSSFARKLNKIKKKLTGTEHAEFFQQENLFILDAALAEELVYNHLHTLMEEFTVFGTDKLKHYRVKPVNPSLKMKVSSGIDFLQGSVELNIDGELFSLQDVFREIKRNSYIHLKDGMHGIISQSYIRRLSRVFQVKDDQVKISFFDLPLVEELISRKIAEESFPDARSVFWGINTIGENIPAVPSLQGTLRSYQLYGYGWLSYLYEHRLGGCLADDMGLGKTLQVITLLAARTPKTEQSSLIIMPKTLLQNWAEEIRKFAPQLSFYIYHGTDRDPKCFGNYPVILSTYGTVRNDIQEIKEIPFDTVVLDESQNIKNTESMVSKAVMLLTANHRFAISGTPIENRLSELYALFRFLNPTMFGSGPVFMKNYANPIQKNNDKDVMQELRKKIYPFVLRRTKKEVLKDLPEKVEQILYVEMEPGLLDFYEQRRSMYHSLVQEKILNKEFQKSRFFIFQALSELRQLASVPERQTDGQLHSPKMDVLIEQLVDLAGNHHKALVFVSYLEAIHLISERLDAEGIGYLTMSGATKNRSQLVNQFQNDDSIQVFIMTLKTGGVGLNLTAADYVFIFDPWWNQAAETQAVDRVHRIGQENKVFSYKLITKGTIEEKILELQRKKKDLSDSLLQSDGEALKQLNEEDIDFIFRD